VEGNRSFGSRRSFNREFYAQRLEDLDIEFGIAGIKAPPARAIHVAICR
jgi:hypothetical protein